MAVLSLVIKKRFISTVSLICLLLHLGCRNTSAPEVLEPELFANIYTQMLVLSMKDTTTDSLDNLQLVLDKFEVPRTKYEQSINYFQQYPEIWLDIFAIVNEELQKIEAEQKEKNKSPD